MGAAGEGERQHGESRNGGSATWLALAFVAVLGCAPRPLVARAIQARGGPLHGLVQDIEADVRVGFPGTWRWRTAFLAPNRYAWTIVTTAEPNHYVFDGRTVRAFVGSAAVAVDADAEAPLRTHARLRAVMNLDAVLAPGVQVAPLPASELSAGVAAGLVVRFDDGTRYRLGFDAQTRLVRVEGPVALPPLASGDAVVTLGDFRSTAGFVLAYRAEYAFRGEPLAVERTLAACPDPPGLTPESFERPATIPDCGRAPDQAAQKPLTVPALP
jgi:hypothetical protein